MKDPCLKCVVQPCCQEICRIRILYTGTVWFETDTSVKTANRKDTAKRVWGIGGADKRANCWIDEYK